MKGKTTIIAIALVAMVGCEWVEKFTKPKEGPVWKESVKRFTSTVPWAGQAVAADTFIKIARKANPAVVNIGTTKIIKGRSPHGFFFAPKGQPSPYDNFFGGDEFFKRFFGQPNGDEAPEMKQKSLGSGFILSDDGYIVTNNHVIDKADEITVTIGQDQEFKAEVIGVDPKTDVALIKVNAAEKLPVLLLGDSDQLSVGEIVVAIGNPFGLSHTVTQGIVSAQERAIGFGPYDNFIQTDASINPGNSGGPLLNLNAEVVGINTAIIASGQGIGFAIPINLAKNIIQQLKEKGSVVRGWLGVYIQKVDPDLAKSLGLKKPKGALISSVQKDSPAAKAGLQTGDVITKFGKEEIETFNELPRVVASTPVGTKSKLEIIRQGKKMEFTIQVGELPASVELAKGESAPKKVEPSKVDLLGLSVRTLTAPILAKLGLPENTEGVLVEKVETGKSSYSKGIRRGDIIIEVNRKKVRDVATYLKETRNLRKGDSVLFLVRRGPDATQFVAFTI